MRNHLPSGTLNFVEGWQPADDRQILVLIWETKSITPDIESSLYTAEVVRDTTLIDVLNSGTLDGLHSLLRDRYGERLGIDAPVDSAHLVEHAFAQP